MNYEQESIFTRAMMTGLFIGVIDTLICLSYNVGYRNITGYTPSALINVSSLIFAVNLILLLIGMLYYIFIKIFGRRDIVFTLVFALITGIGLWQTEIGHRFADPAVNNGFRGLLFGIVLVLGASATALPALYHSKFFDKYVL